MKLYNTWYIFRPLIQANARTTPSFTSVHIWLIDDSCQRQGKIWPLWLIKGDFEKNTIFCQLVLSRTQSVGSKYGILEGSGGFVVRFEWTNLGSEGFEFRFFQIWAWVWPIFGQTDSKFGLFGGDWKGLMFGFGGRTWVQKSSTCHFWSC